MSYQSGARYAGDMLSADAYRLLAGDATSTLIDVRTQAEWALCRSAGSLPPGQDRAFSGVADISLQPARLPAAGDAPVASRVQWTFETVRDIEARRPTCACHRDCGMARADARPAGTLGKSLGFEKLYV